MVEKRSQVWLSEAGRDAERRATGRATLANRLRAAVRRGGGTIGEWAGGGYGVLFPVVLLVILHVIFLVVPAIPGAPNVEDGREFVSSLWQVSATVISIAFVLLILIVEVIHRSVHGEYLWRQFARSSALFMVTAFLLGAIVAIGAGAFWLIPTTGWAPVPSARLSNLVLLDILLFAMSLAAVLWLYVNVFRFLNPGFVHRLAVESVSKAVREELSGALRAKVENHILGEECKSLGFLRDPGATHWGQMQPVHLDAPRVVIDVNLRELRKLSDMLTSTTEPRAIVAVSPGQRLTRDGNVGVLIRQEDRGEKVEAQARRCFKMGRGGGVRRRDLQEAFAALTEQAMRAIEMGRQEQFRSTLNALAEPIRVALETLGSYGIAFDPETAQNIFPFEWPALERPLREYERIVEAAARSGDSDIVVEAAYWPYRVMRLSVEERDHYYFREAVRYFPYLYDLSRGEVPDRSRTLLAHRAWSHLKDFGFLEITSRLRGSQDSGLLDALRSYSAELFLAFTNLLRAAIDAGDREYFSEAAHGFWQAVNIQFATDSPGIAFDLTQRDPFAGASGELGDTKAAALVYIADRRDALWFSLGAWLCHRCARSDLSPDHCHELFEELAKPFQDFRRLWRAFNSALSTESDDRLPLSRWEMREHPSEEMVMLRPEADLALFLTLVALRNIPSRASERVRSLPAVREARWAKSQVTAALEQFRSGRERWMTVIGERETADQEAEIEALMDAAEADEEQRERLRIMEQEVSASKLGEFKADFLEAWASSGLMRGLFMNVDGVEYVRESPPNLRVQRFLSLMSKGPFVDDPGRTHWSSVGRNFGAGMADGENQTVYQAIRKGAPSSRPGRVAVGTKLTGIIERLGERGTVPDVILVNGGWVALEHLREDSEFVPSYVSGEDRPWHFQGTFKGIPLHMIYLSDEPEFLVVSLRAVGRLRQFLAESESIFRNFEVKGYSQELAEEVAAGDRSQVPTEARELPEDELVEYLRERVRVNIEQALHMRVDDRMAARRLVLPRPE